MIKVSPSDRDAGLPLLVKRRAVPNVFVGCATLAEGTEERYTAIRNECWALGMRTHRSYALEGEPTVAEDAIKRIADADLFVFDLSHDSPTVRAELDAAVAIGRATERMLFIAAGGAHRPPPAALGKVRACSTLESLRLTVREWAAPYRGDLAVAPK